MLRRHRGAKTGFVKRTPYVYDNGGNRKQKIDAINLRTWTYQYDIDDTSLYGTANNRLMKAEEKVTGTGALVSTTWYYYNCSGNVTRVVTKSEASSTYSATRMVYAKNERTVSFVLGESWSYPGGDITQCPTTGFYALSYTREFRYDTGRARYLNRTLSTSALLQNPSVYSPTSSTWTEYDDDDAYDDFTVSGTTLTVGNFYEPGLWRKESGVSQFMHNDHLGTLRLTSNTSGQSDSVARVFTAFGERSAGPSGMDRYGYVGEHGYQTDPSGAFPFLHLGARYYDPGSGRFLQRDPIGIEDQANVYAYVANAPTILFDPEGEWIASAGRAAWSGAKWAAPYAWRGAKWTWSQAKAAGRSAGSCFGPQGRLFRQGSWLNKGKFRFGWSKYEGYWRFSFRYKHHHFDVPRIKVPIGGAGRWGGGGGASW